MGTVETILLAALVLDAIALTVLVLLQQGKGADVGAAFGSGSSNTMFGSGGGAPFLTKLTAWLAIGFFAITFALAFIAKDKADSAGSIGIPTADGAPIVETPSEESVQPEPVGDIPAIDDSQSTDDIPGDVPGF